MDTTTDQQPTTVEQWYDRSSRSWVTSLRDQDGMEIDCVYDGTRDDAASARRYFEGQIASAKAGAR